MAFLDDLLKGINQIGEDIFGNPFEVIGQQFEDGYQFGDIGRGIIEYIGGTGGQENSPLTGLTTNIDSAYSTAKDVVEETLPLLNNVDTTIHNLAMNASDNKGVPEEHFTDSNINPEISTPAELNQDLIDYFDKILERNDARVREQNDFNASEARKNRKFQEYMSNTAYQRAVEDMKKAGINPIMAFSNGGASTPSGSTAVSTYNSMSAPSPVSGIDVGNLSVSQVANLIADANLSLEQEKFLVNKLSDMVSSSIKIADLIF